MKIYNNIMGKTSFSFAYRILKENILRLDMKPGEEIKEFELLATLGMSRTPVREALILLKHEGLVENIQNRTYISKIDKEKFKDGTLMRMAIEEKILLKACDYFPEEYLEKLKKNLEKQNYILKTSRDYIEFRKVDLEFHQIIFEGVGHKNLFTFMTDGFLDYQRMGVMFCVDKIRDDFVFQGHKEFFNIIKEKKKDEVIPTLTAHLNRLIEKFDDIASEHPYYFK